MDGKTGYMMTAFLSFAGGASSAKVDKPGILYEITDSFIAFGLIPKNMAVPQARDLSDYTGNPNIRHAYYSYNNIVDVSVIDNASDGSVTFSLGVAMADFPGFKGCA